MCRLFGQVSDSDQSAADFLLRRRFSLLQQSRLHPKAKQKDGWGLAWKTEDGWSLERSKDAVFKESRRFSALARRAAGLVVIAHIRHASNPRKLPKERLIGLDNSQPFVHRGLAFAHNGTLNIPDQVARGLGRRRALIRGENDSEVLFWLFVREWETAGADRGAARWMRVFARMRRAIDAAWKSTPKSRRKHAAASHGLNFLASDGRDLAAHCWYDRPDGRSLCGQDRPYFEMCYNRSDDKTVVASEPMDSSRGWRPIPAKHLLLVRPDGTVSLKRLT